MSFNQIYTWKDHRTECTKCHPKKGKRPKRTSKEANSCFEKAFQAKVKEIVKGREEKKKAA